MAARSGDIDTAKRRLIAASIDEQLQGAQLDTISKPGTASNEKYLATLQGLQQKQSGDFSYTGVHGETRTLHMDNLQNINLGSGQFNGAPLGTAVNEKLSKFIQGSYIPDKVAEITNKFSTLQNTAGVNYEKLLSTAQSISQDWNTFKSKQFLQPFALQLSTADQNQVSSFMAQGLINELDNKFTSNGIDDKGAMAQFTKIQQLFPTATGTDFENKKLNLEKNIANPNYQNFVNDNSSQLDTEINHVQSAMSTIQSNASGSNPDGTSRAFDHGAYNKLNADLQTLTTAKSTFHNSYGSNYLDQNYSKFLPDKTGKIAPPTFTLPKTSGVAGSILPLPKSVAPAPHTGNFYSSNNQGTNQGTQNQTTSPKTTIGSTAIGKAIPNGDILKKYQPSETIKQGNGFYLKPGIDQRW